MKTFNYMLLLILATFMFQGCDDSNKNKSFFADDELPRIFMEQWAALQPVQINGTIKWSPLVSPSDGATYKWTYNGEVISTEKDLDYTVSQLGEYELKFEVTRNEVVNSRTATVLVTRPFIPKETNKKSIAYIDAIDGNVSAIKWENITHLVISSALVKEGTDKDGNIRYVDLEFKDSKLGDLNSLVEIAHNYGVFVSLQISGEHSSLNGLPVYGSYGFYNIITDKAKRDDLIKQVLDFVQEKKLDGVDIYLDKAHDGAFPQPKIVKEFYQEFAKSVPAKSEANQDFLLSASVVVGWTRTSNQDLASIERYNWISVLAFAQEDLSPAPHSSAWSCSDNAAFWTGAGLKPEKVIIASPAFSLTYDFKGNTPTWGNLYLFTTYTPYNELLKSHPNAYSSNSLSVADGLFYDGFPAIEEKAAMVKSQGYGGMALWKVNFDAMDASASLMKKIGTTLEN